MSDPKNTDLVPSTGADAAEKGFLQLKGLQLSIFQERYAWAGEDWLGACSRVATANSKAETNGKVGTFQTRFFEQLAQGKFAPGGRFWYASGRKKQQTMNCYVLGVEDSIEGWGQLMADTSTISARGGGVGINFSPIRPRGYGISGMGGNHYRGRQPDADYQRYWRRDQGRGRPSSSPDVLPQHQPPGC